MSLRFGGAFLYLFSIPLLFALAGPIATLATIVAVPLVLVGTESLLPGREVGPAPQRTRAFRAMPLLYVAYQLAVTGWAARVAARPETGWLGLICLGLSTGVTAGIFGMLAAHELIHSRSRSENAVGVLMLTAMSYRHFRIAHIYGHHRHAASERDPTTARLGESYYAFVPRTLAGQFQDAWRHEAARARRVGGLVANRVMQDLLMLGGVYAVLGFALGPRAVALFALESAVAIAALELFNYVAHYGMVRRPGEAFSDAHSWNASHAVGNALLFNMGRHSDHHRHAASSYQTLDRIEAGPELPAGYAGSMLLALIPPLWRMVMDRRLAQLHPVPAG